MAYKISIRPSAVKDLDLLPDKEVQKKLALVSKLQEQPRPIGIQKLSDEEGYCILSGDYRFLFEINDKDKFIYIYRIKHRKDVYRK